MCKTGSCEQSIETANKVGTANKYEVICLKILTTINRIAIVAIGVFEVPVLFASSFAIGAGVSFFNNHYHWYEEKKIDLIEITVSCALQSFENASGQKFPRIIGLAIAIITTLHHIEEAACIFGPIGGLSLGMWTGSNLWHMGINFHQLQNHQQLN